MEVITNQKSTTVVRVLKNTKAMSGHDFEAFKKNNDQNYKFNSMNMLSMVNVIDE